MASLWHITLRFNSMNLAFAYGVVHLEVMVQTLNGRGRSFRTKLLKLLYEVVYG